MAVVTHSRFKLDKLDQEALKAMGVEVLQDFPSDDELGIDDVQFGEEILGTLSDEEFSIFVDMIGCNNEVTRIAKSMAARKIREMADKVESTDESMLNAAVEAVQNADKNLFASDEERETFFRLSAKLNLLKSTFYWVMGEKFNVHDWRCGVRTRRRFVKIGKRNENG